jgi:exonuclease III
MALVSNNTSTERWSRAAADCFPSSARASSGSWSTAAPLMKSIQLAATTAALVVVCLLAAEAAVSAQTPAPQTFKVAFYNIQSGKGEPALPGVASPFPDTSNCTNPSLPLNAWGLGIVQRELAAHLGNDPSVVALGLAEAWTCASPSAVRNALGWRAASSERNGVGIVARHGFGGPETWLQLDTTRNVNPKDTMWVLRVPVCLDTVCSRTVMVFTAHWYAVGQSALDDNSIYEFQAQQTIDFMGALPAGQPHILIGDLNVFAGREIACGKIPMRKPLERLSGAGYVDAWPAVHALADGNTGMWNRPGCGTPEGNVGRRIDYVWSKELAPLSMTRFGMVKPGEAAPSDHAGIRAEFPTPAVKSASVPPTAVIRAPAAGGVVSGNVAVVVDAQDDQAVVRVELLLDGAPLAVSRTPPFSFSWNTAAWPNGAHTLQAAASDAAGNRTLSTVTPLTVSNPVAPGEEVVLFASDAAYAGTWRLVDDSTAANGKRIQSPDAGASRLTYVPTRPASYVDLFFDAVAGKPYRLWIRGKAEGNSPLNDAIYAQFDGSVNASGVAVNRIGTVTGLSIDLEDCDGCGLSGWGWQDTARQIDVLGPVVYFAVSGRQQMRIQAREDGIGLDQFVLSTRQYLTQAPGAPRDDATILPRQGLPLNKPPTVALTSPAQGSTFTAPATITITASAADADGAMGRVDFYAGATFVGSRSASPYSVSWNNVAAGTYALTAQAFDASGAAAKSAAVTVQVVPVVSSAKDEIVLHTAGAPVVVGRWSRTPDATAASGARLQNPDAGAAKVLQALSAPVSYFELTFDADASKPYRLWIRAVAQNNHYYNDSVYVQFDRSTDAAGNPVNRIGTTSATNIVLEDCGGCAMQGWGWQDNGYAMLGPLVYFATSGPQRLRIQVREDGIGIDQVVLSAVKYKTQPPGATRNDATILPASGQ